MTSQKKPCPKFIQLYNEYLAKGYSVLEAGAIASGILAGKSPEEAIKDAKEPFLYM